MTWLAFCIYCYLPGLAGMYMCHFCCNCCGKAQSSAPRTQEKEVCRWLKLSPKEASLCSWMVCVSASLGRGECRACKVFAHRRRYGTCVTEWKASIVKKSWKSVHGNGRRAERDAVGTLLVLSLGRPVSKQLYLMRPWRQELVKSEFSGEILVCGRTGVRCSVTLAHLGTRCGSQAQLVAVASEPLESR